MQSSPSEMPMPALAPKRLRSPMALVVFPQPDSVPMIDEPAPTSELDATKTLYGRIVRPLAEAQVAEFVLIRRTHDEDPASFYIQVDKVSNAKFAAAAGDAKMQDLLQDFKHKAPWSVPMKWTSKGQGPDWSRLPAFNVS